MKNPCLALSCVLLSLALGCDPWGPGPAPPAPEPEPTPPAPPGPQKPVPNDQPPAACGGEGQRCCEPGNACAAGLVCDAGRCAAPIECRGPVDYAIGIVERQWRCPVTVRAQPASSAAAALLCVALRLPSDLDAVLLLPGGATAEFTYCLTSELGSHTTVQVEAFSAADARSCANKQCVNCTVAETPGPCP